MGSEDWWATVITAITNTASTTIPSAPSTTEFQRRSGVKSGNAACCASTAADHGPSTSLSSAAKPTSKPVPTYSGRVVVVAGVSASASRVPCVEEMVLYLRGVVSSGRY